MESLQIIVRKKDGTRELFDEQKLLAGIMKATQKRPVNAQEIVADIETELQNGLRQEVSTNEIGEMVMQELKKRDHVAYVRFASVYREFQDINSFMDELRAILEEKEREELEK